MRLSDYVNMLASFYQRQLIPRTYSMLLSYFWPSSWPVRVALLASASRRWQGELCFFQQIDLVDALFIFLNFIYGDLVYYYDQYI